jgi:hypothetical protein
VLEERLTGAIDCPSANEGLQITAHNHFNESMGFNAPAPRCTPQFILNPGCVF